MYYIRGGHGRVVSWWTLITPAVVPKRQKSYFEIIVLGWICAVQSWILNTWRGDGFDCLFTLISIKLEHPWPLQVCTIVCIIQYMMHTQGYKCLHLTSSQWKTWGSIWHTFAHPAKPFCYAYLSVRAQHQPQGQNTYPKIQ